MEKVSVSSRELIRLQESLNMASIYIGKVQSILEFMGITNEDSLPQNVPFEQIAKDIVIGGGYTVKGISIPVGIDSNRMPVHLKLGYDTGDYHVSVLGRPGYGKTVMVRNIICGCSLKYSPEELAFYLVDNNSCLSEFKKLPHVKSITRGKEGFLEVIRIIEEEMSQRELRFSIFGEEQNCFIDRYETYRLHANVRLPRIIMVIDDFYLSSAFFDQTGKPIEEGLTKVLRKGWRYGIHVVVSSQKLDMVYHRLITKEIMFNDVYHLADSNMDRLRRGEAYMTTNDDGYKRMIKFKCAYSNNYYQQYVCRSKV